MKKLRPEERHRLMKEMEKMEKETGMKIPKGVCICLEEHTGYPIIFGADAPDQEAVSKFNDRFLETHADFLYTSTPRVKEICSGIWRKVEK
jgi:hypothetical protein